MRGQVFRWGWRHVYAWLSVPTGVEASVCVVKCSGGVEASVCVVGWKNLINIYSRI